MKTSYEDVRQSAMTMDIRRCQFCLTYLNNTRRIPIANCDQNDIHSCQMAINNMISMVTSDKSERARLIAELEQACTANILPISHFDWLKEDKRAAFWLWAYINQTQDNILGVPSTSNPLDNMYNKLGLSSSPCNHQERLSLIISFMDRFPVSPQAIGFKENLLEKFKEKWKFVYAQPIPLKWLPDEEASVQWVWESLQKHFANISGASSPMFLSTLQLTHWFTPYNHAERLLAVRAALDLWVDAPDSKRLFLLNLNKAWNQRKLRQQRTDKKAVNTYLRNDTKAQLDSLAVHYKMRISDVLEMLIKERHQQIKSSS
ncbi:hypothetical protein [Aeromonas veronii]|uniref:hypothetical protein n=1 Tax=Aeromonas veronii TaxID=654 RepID=UPI001302E221|nr:hypothetical protein [Aeromonas veronii]KAE9627778.1 hypothetical protein GO977_21770 [Aeromonas veronii]